MNKYLYIFAATALFAACENQSQNQVEETENTTEALVEETAQEMNFYGDTITADGAISAQQLAEIVHKDGGYEGKVVTTIHETCKKKGCWMMVDLEGEEDMRVTFKDYGFFVPKEGVEGREVIMEGVAYLDTTSVEMLRHYAEDAGKPAEEIEKITEPEYALAFEATGVIIKE